MDEILRQILELQEYGAPQWWIQNWFARTHPQLLDNQTYVNAIVNPERPYSETERPDFDVNNQEGPNNFSESWDEAYSEEMFPSREDEDWKNRRLGPVVKDSPIETVKVNGYRVDRSGIYRPTPNMAFELGSPYGWRQLRYQQVMDDPNSTPEQKEEALAMLGQQATAQEEQEAFKFWNSVKGAWDAEDEANYVPRMDQSKPRFDESNTKPTLEDRDYLKQLASPMGTWGTKAMQTLVKKIKVDEKEPY